MINIILKASDSLPWPLKVGAKFLQVHPFGTICAVLLALPGQIALIASFLLPIKIIMLMASEGMPNYLPESLASMDKKILVGTLAALSIASFLSYHLINKAIDLIARSGSSRIEQRNQKLHLFEGQKELTLRSYTRYIEALASFTFTLLGLALLLFIYPEIALTCVAYISLCIFACAAIKYLTKMESDVFFNSIQKKLSTISGIGFFLVFSWVLIDYVFFSIPEGFITLLVSVILARQIFSRSNLVVNSAFFFIRQKQKLKALLFHKAFFEPSVDNRGTIWDFLDPSTAAFRRLSQFLESISETPHEKIELSWKDSGLSGIAFIKAFCTQSERTLLVKIFDKKKKTDARHEATLLYELPEELPCPSLLESTSISDLTIHIFDITGYAFPIGKPNQSTTDEIALKIGKTPVPATLLSRYTRSHKMLWDQLADLDRKHLGFLSNDQDKTRYYLDRLSEIRQDLKQHPLRIYNPQLGNANIYAQSPTGNTEILHWAKWVIEPLGASLTPSSIKTLSPRTIPKNQLENPEHHLEKKPDPRISYLSQLLCNQIQQQLPLKAAKTLEELCYRSD